MSSEVELIRDFEFFKPDEIISVRIPKAIQKLNSTLKLDNDDKLIAILRHFKWNINRVFEDYFGNEENLEKKIGISDFDIIKQFKQNRDEIGLGCKHFFSNVVWK